MQRLEVSGAVRPLYVSLGVKGLSRVLMSVSRVRRNTISLGILLNRQMHKRTDVVSTQSVMLYLIKGASIINTRFEYNQRFSQNSEEADLFSVDRSRVLLCCTRTYKTPPVTHHETLLLISLVIIATGITEQGREASVRLNESWPVWRASYSCFAHCVLLCARQFRPSNLASQQLS